MADASLTFVAVDAGGDMTFSGVDDTNPLGLVAMTQPGRVARIAYADDSPHVDGSLALAASWQQAVISASVHLVGTSQADLDAKVARLFAALGRLRHTVVQTVNGVDTTWTCDMGSATPDELDPDKLDRFEAIYSLSIPCYPLGA